MIIILCLFLLLPTLVARRFVTSLGVGSELLSISMAWFAGQAGAVIATLCVASALSPWCSDLLLRAACVVVFLSGAILWIGGTIRPPGCRLPGRRGFPLAAPALVAFSAIAAYSIYSPHLWIEDGWITRSHVYWDFILHFPLVQTFAHGDNFPPQHEAFAGLPLAYHYFFDLMCAIYARLGLDLVGGINLASIASLFFLLLLLGGLGEELLGSVLAGWLAGMMSLTSGSMRFLFDLAKAREQGLSAAISAPLSDGVHPYTFGFLDGNPYGYNGTMHNVFYFIAERQLVFGCGLLLAALFAIHGLPGMKPGRALLLGAAFGLCFQWHLFVTVMIGAALTLCLLGPGRTSTLACLFGYGAVCFGHYAYFSMIASNPEWFLPRVGDVPRLSFEFTTNSNYGPGLGNAIGYWVFAYGVKPIVAFAGFLALRERNRRLAFVLAAFVVPAFVMINSVQLSPISVYDNHKWLKPMNLLVDLAAGFAIAVFLERQGRRAVTLGAAAACTAALCLSGTIELLPFLAPKQVVREGPYPSEMTHALQTNTPARGVILARDTLDVLLAGRRVFLEFSGDIDLGYRPYMSFGLNKAPREELIHRIYRAYGRRDLCEQALHAGIDFIEFTLDMQRLPVYRLTSGWPAFETFSDRLGAPLRYVSLAPCREIP